MPNPIKYTTGSETLALKKGNFYIGTGDVGKGPSDTTGFYQGVSPSAGGYVIYMNKSGAPGDLSYHNAANDSELISFTNNLAGTSYTTANECLVYFAGQTDKVVLNRDYEGIVTDGLVLNLDAGFTPSYPRSGTTWSDVGGTNNGTLINGPTFNSGDGGSIVFDGTNDFVEFNNNSIFNFGTSNISFRFIVTTKNNTFNRWNALYIKRGSGSDDIRTYIRPQTSADGILRLYIAGSTSMDITTPIINILGTFDINFVLIRSQYWAIYINGVLIGTNNTNNAFTDKQNSNISGLASPRFGNQLGGEYPNLNLFNFQIYNRALTATEVLQNYNAQKGRFGL